MIELGRHIEILLLHNDCVIVPDFGGFVAYQIGSRYDEEDFTWLPPMRTLGFNPQLRLNDSLLVQSYVTAYDLSYPEALHRIENEVAALKEELANEGYFNFEDVGIISINTEGNYEFEPCEAGILSPDYYGLGGCQFPTLRDARTAPKAKAVELAPAEIAVEEPVASQQDDETEAPAGAALLEFTDDDNNSDIRTIRIRMSWVRNTVAVAAAIIAFFVMATPIANSDLGTRTMSHLQNNLLYKLIPQDTNIVPASPVADTLPMLAAKNQPQQGDAIHQAETEGAKTETVEAKTDSVREPYSIVLASHVRLSNAEYYVEQLKKRGYEQAAVYIHNKVVRVIYGSFEDENAAYRQLNKMNKEEEFSEAWVYKRPEA